MINTTNNESSQFYRVRTKLHFFKKKVKNRQVYVLFRLNKIKINPRKNNSLYIVSLKLGDRKSNTDFALITTVLLFVSHAR